MDIYSSIGRRHCARLEPPATGIREKGASVRDGKTRLLILPYLLALLVSIVIVITPVEVEAKKYGGGYSDDHDDDDDDDHDDDNGGHDPDPPGPTNGGGGKKSRDRDSDGGQCFAIDGVNPCINYTPKRDPRPVEIAPGVFQYYGAFGQVIGTAIVTSSPEFEPIVPRGTFQEPQPVAIVKKAAPDPEQEKAPEVRKRTILPAEKSGDQILDVLIIQALERVEPEPVQLPAQSVPACECLP